MKSLSCSLSIGSKYTTKMFRIFRKIATGNTVSFSEPKKPSNYLKIGSIKLLHRTFREDLIMSIGLLHVCAKIVCFLFFVYIFGLLKIWAYLCAIFVLQNPCVLLLWCISTDLDMVRLVRKVFYTLFLNFYIINWQLSIRIFVVCAENSVI